MGLDLALGVFVLIWAIRGWFKGFLLQAIDLAALVGCVYLADPVRDQIRPFAKEYLPSIQPEVLDRLLWWSSAVLSYVVTSGVARMIVKARRKSPYGDPEPNRGDQGAGFALGAAKGLIASAFLASAIVKYAPGYVKPGGVVEEQAKASKALAWSAEYQPADRIWSSTPVQSFVAHVRRRGFWDDSARPGENRDETNPTPAPVADETRPPSKPPTPPDATGERSRSGSKPPAGPVQTASRPRTLSLPRASRLDPKAPDFRRALDEQLRALGLDLPTNSD